MDNKKEKRIFDKITVVAGSVFFGTWCIAGCVFYGIAAVKFIFSLING